MPSPSRTWTHSWNNEPTSQASTEAQNREYLRTLKDAIKAAGWAVEGSSDSSAAGMDNTDRWDSDTDLVWESGGSAHSWFVLSSPSNYPSTGKTLYFTIALSTGASNQHLVNFSIATAIPTGGSTTADPTQPANSRTFTNRQVLPSPVMDVFYHISYNTAGDWFTFVNERGKGHAAFASHTLQAVSPDTGCNYPCHFLCSYDDTAPGASNEVNWRTNTHAAMFWQDDTVISANNTFGTLRYEIGTIDYPDQQDSAGSDISGEYIDLPLILANNVTAQKSTYGRLPDNGFAPTDPSVPQGAAIPKDTSYVTKLGDFWWPNGGTIPNI